MLNLILGRNGSGKTQYVRSLVADGVKNGGKGYIMIVPEQFSYETEREMLSLTGAENMLKIDVLSLSRLADIILEQYGKNSTKQPVDDGVRLVSMSLAIESLGEKAKIFEKYIKRPQLVSQIVSFATELRHCSVDPAELSHAADNMRECSLREKLSELSLIVSMYNAIISRDFYDDNTALDILYDVLCENNYFSGKTVVVDSFTRFTKQELKIIGKIIEQSNDTYFTFCTDVKETAEDDFSMFGNVSMQVEIIKRLANEKNVKIATPVVLEEAKEKRNEFLSALEKNLYRNEITECFGNTEGIITVVSAPDITMECEYVAATIKKLMREENFRCRDMIVYERKKDTYDNELEAAFRKYDVPFFEDKRQPIDAQPLIIFLSTLFDISLHGLNTETLVRHLKTGLSALSQDEISELENYALIWKIRPSGWGEDFTENPRGLGFQLNDFDKEELKKLNSYRKKAVAPVLKFRKEFKDAVGGEKTKVIYDYLMDNHISHRLKQLALKLSDDGKTTLYEEQDSVWSLLMGILDRLYLATAENDVSVERYFELFGLLLSVTDFGTIPQGLDDVTVAAADRSRTSLKKVVFIVGANDGVFPLNPSTKGLLNDSERLKLKDLGVELAETAEYKQTEEKFIAYSAVSMASEKLFISYSAADYSGTSLSASSLVENVCEIFPDISVRSTEITEPLEKIESDASAFETFAEHYKKKDRLNATLQHYFDGNVAYNGRVASLKKAADKTEQKINNTELAKELFGKNMYVSASKTEVYYKCPFEYFCKYGIRAQPRKEAELDAAITGTVIHFVFENVLRTYSKQQLTEMSDDELKIVVDNTVNLYLEENMGGTENKSKRFLRHYKTAGNQALTILKRMIEEFKVCEFSPVDFELSINHDGEITPYKLELQDGCSLEICGSVDRVDVMEKNGKKYLRIVDYKSGGKKFNLYDVMEGLSTQMLIYLFAIDANGKDKYGNIVPSGILYMSAKPEPSDLGRNASEDEINKKRLLSNRMSGLVLNDIDVILGMEKDGEGVFIPVMVDEDGKAKGKIITTADFNNLKKKVDTILVDMVGSLQNGNIPVLPAGEDACEWCDYKSVCGFEKGDNIRTIEKLSDEKVLEILEQEETDDGEEKTDATEMD